MRVEVEVGPRGGQEGLERRREQMRRAKERSQDFRATWRDAEEQGLDWAVAEELERLAAGEVWEEAEPEARDPYAPQVRMRVEKRGGVRFATLTFEVRNRSEDELVVEVAKRLGD